MTIPLTPDALRAVLLDRYEDDLINATNDALLRSHQIDNIKIRLEDLLLEVAEEDAQGITSLAHALLPTIYGSSWNVERSETEDEAIWTFTRRNRDPR